MHKRTLGWFAASIFAGLALSLLNWQVQQGYTAAFDQRVLNQLGALHGNVTVTKWIEALTWAGSLWVLVPLFAIVLFFLIRMAKPVPAACMALVFTGSIASTWLLKWIMERTRPIEWGYLAMQMPQDFSYPSAHTTQVMAFALALISFVLPRDQLRFIFASMFLMSLAVAVAFSRLYLFVHWPTDVIAGTLVATSWVCFAAGLRDIYSIKGTRI